MFLDNLSGFSMGCNFPYDLEWLPKGLPNALQGTAGEEEAWKRETPKNVQSPRRPLNTVLGIV